MIALGSFCCNSCAMIVFLAPNAPFNQIIIIISSEQISLLFNLGARLLLIFLAFVFVHLRYVCHLKDSLNLLIHFFHVL